jgi:hypothetical protein
MEERGTMNISNLKVERVLNPIVLTKIPRELFEQIDAMEWDIDETINKLSLIIPSDLTFFYVMYDNEEIQALLWLDLNMFSKNFYVTAFSVSHKYRSNSNIKLVAGMIKELKEGIEAATGAKLGKLLEFATTKPDKYEIQGFKRSENILMEIDYENVPDIETKGRTKESGPAERDDVLHGPVESAA